MSSLVLLSLSPAFSDLWPELAVTHGLAFSAVQEVAELATARGVLLIAAGGDEPRALEALRALGEAGRGVAVVGASTNHRMAVSMMRAGASEYFALPGDLELLHAWLAARAGEGAARAQRSAFARLEGRTYAMREIIGNSVALRQALGIAERIIPVPNVTVLIGGETGTGKELVARAIHYHGPRSEAPFVDINCAAIPEQLLESELFGHERGAFTGATTAKPGLFEVANGGTIFLDEIGHLALGLQGKLLRALEERTIRRVGGQRSIAIDLRVIAATHVDLGEAVRAGTFRADLYHRLNVIPLTLPALRHRRDDILPLARHFLSRLARDYQRSTPRLMGEAESAILAHDWPGNVRELRNAMERALLLAPDDVLTASDFAFLDRTPGPVEGSSGALQFPGPLHALVRSAATEMIQLCGGNKSEAARRLGISRPRLMRLTGHGASRDETSGAPYA